MAPSGIKGLKRVYLHLILFCFVCFKQVMKSILRFIIVLHPISEVFYEKPWILRCSLEYLFKAQCIHNFKIWPVVMTFISVVRKS